MTDITLAEYNGQAWLVRGESFLDDLLANTLADGISIELLECECKADVHALWILHCGAQDMAADPWIIHPGIVRRVRDASQGSLDFRISFAPWSVLIDDAARQTIERAILAAARNPLNYLSLVAYAAPDAEEAVTSLINLRIHLVRQQLLDGGIGTARIVPELHVLVANEDSQRLDIILTDVGEPA